MNTRLILSALALAPMAIAGTCSASIHRGSVQGLGNPDGTNTASANCGITITYADGRTDDFYPEDGCNYAKTQCYPSELPYLLCVKSNFNYRNGYMEYADQHLDFNSDYCEQKHTANPLGASDFTECHFDC